MTIENRLAEIALRHRGEDPVLPAARLSRIPDLLAAAERVRRRLGQSHASGLV